MATHPRNFCESSAPNEALQNVDRLASLPHVRLISERVGNLELYRNVTKNASVRANLVPDAHLASILRLHGVPTLYTNNVDDFKRFGSLDVRNPLL